MLTQQKYNKVLRFQTLQNKTKHYVGKRDVSDAYMKVALTYLYFLAEVSTKLKKYTFFDNFRVITQERDMKTTQMTTFS